MNIFSKYLPTMQTPRFPVNTTCSLKLCWESDLVEALVSCLHLAKEEYRIRIGFERCLNYLEVSPDSVLMCIQALGADMKDPLSHMQLLLIEAYCQENNIRVLKLVCQDIWELIDMKSAEYFEEYNDGIEDSSEIGDDNIMLIQAAAIDHIEDEELRKFYDLAALHCHARPIVRLRS
ncbi:uncharacterized protein LOC129602666 [Paramacrobiotus metropolitanus]|uniref:uncharacterized protein LOC129602666 n=1 Tax=Paramacrobiotus metropolitanus TaxID=2943436 RepID=UPI0024463E38|nr:uncharacterized protein LOC129602666 [Paramacrobiotus metropolitanus]